MIEIGRRVSVLYEGRLEDGTVFDSSEAHKGSPLVFVVGAGTVIPGLEKAVAEMDPFEKRTVIIPAREAYGERDPELVQKIPATGFPDAGRLPVGDYIALDIAGERCRAKVAAVEDDVITLDFNHEYAGQNLVFDLEVVDVYGETGSLVENEQHGAGCQCGCHKLKSQLNDAEVGSVHRSMPPEMPFRC